MRKSKAIKKLLSLPPGKFNEIDLTIVHKPGWMSRAFQNNRYMVMICDNAKTNKGKAIKALIQRHDDMPIPNHWAEIQKIKNEIFGEETLAIEYYPKESQLIDEHNIYWIWIFPEGVLPIPK